MLIKKYFLFKIFAIFFGVVVFSSQTIFPIKASAQVSGYRHPVHAAEIYQATQFLSTCLTWGFGTGSQEHTFNSEDINSGNFFNQGGQGRKVGHLLSSNGEFSCTSSSDVAAAFEATGFSGTDLLGGAGLISQEADGWKLNNDLNFNWGNRGGSSTSAWQALQSFISEQYPDITTPTATGRNLNTRSPGGDMRNSGQYFALAAAFESCIGSRDGMVTVPIVNPQNGESNNEGFELTSEDDTVIVGPGINTGLGRGADEGFNDLTLSCSEIVDGMMQLAEDASRAIRECMAAGNCEYTGSAIFGGGDNDPARCESSLFSLAWLVCPVVNGLADLSDAIFDNLIVPFLTINPINTDGSDPNNALFGVWSSFRIFANLLLVIFLLVAIFGQTIGGGMIDAYTAKKIVPRVVLTAILINISIYIVALALDVTNIIGGGIAGLITMPFADADGWRITISGGAAGTLGLGALVASGAAIWAFSSAIIPLLLLFVVLPAVLIFVAIMGTLIIRTALVYLLVMVSPIAFALYCLPNTEKFFKQWWSLLSKALLLYPVVMIMFATANVTSVILSDTFPTSSSGIEGAISSIASVIMLLIPLFLIPKVFKFTGGALGSLYGSLSGIGAKTTEAMKGDARNPHSLRNKLKYNAQSKYSQRRGNLYNKLSEATKGGDGSSAKRSLAKRRTASTLARMVNYGNLEAERALKNKEQDEIIAAQYSQGGDNSVRAFWAEQDSEGRWYMPYKDENGKQKEVSASDVAKARSIVGKDPSRVQSYAKYEFGKAQNDGQLEAFKQRYASMVNNNELGWTPKDAGETWAGIKFAHQGTRLEQKHTSLTGEKGALKFDTNREGERGVRLEYGDVNHSDFSEELTDKVRSYDFANFRPSTANAAKEGFLEHAAIVSKLGGQDPSQLSPEDRQKLNTSQKVVKNYETVASGLETRMRSGMRIGPTEEGAEGMPPEGYNVGTATGGSARADAAWNDFVQTVRGGPSQPQAPRPSGAPNPTAKPDDDTGFHPGGYA